jgi:hypothetical protein
MRSDIRVVSLAERPDLDELPFGPGWPQFLFHDPVAKRCLPVVDEAFPDLNLVVIDGDEIVAGGWAIKLAWDGTLPDLPTGWDDALERAVADLEAGRRGDTLVTMAAEVVGSHRGQRLSSVVLRELIARAPERAIAPVRPTEKALRPRMPIEDYAALLRDDGLPQDPWLRTHVRLGGRILGVATRSMVIEGTVAEWERWTQLSFSESGAYELPDALAPVEIDREADRGLYIEPAVWVRHR